MSDLPAFTSRARDPRQLLLVLVLVLSPASLLLSLAGSRGLMLEMAAGIAVLAAARLTPGLADPDRSIATAGAGLPLFSGVALLATLFAGLAAGRTATLLFAIGLVVLGTVLPWTAASRVYRAAGADSEGSERTLAVFGMLLTPFLAALLAVGVGATVHGISPTGVMLAALGAGGLVAVVVKVCGLAVVPQWVHQLALAAVLVATAGALVGIVVAPQPLVGVDAAGLGASWAVGSAVAAIVALVPLLATLPVAFANERDTSRHARSARSAATA